MTRSIVLLLLVAFGLAGCEATNGRMTEMFSFGNKTSKKEQEDKHRITYQKDRDPEALRWLLANCVDTGMTVKEVNQILGEEGRREANSRWLTTKGGHYRMGDKAYQWGPDKAGHTLYLIFREDRLVNFDPKQFSDSAAFGDFQESDDLML